MDKGGITVSGVLLATLFGLAGCGGRATIPVEEHSTVPYKRSPTVSPHYSPATPSREEPVRVKVNRAVKAPAVEQAPAKLDVIPIEPEPQKWREVSSPPSTSGWPDRVQPESGANDPLLGLLKKIELAMQAGDHGRAEGLLERALRIDSQRAGLWHDLAQVRYHQSSYREAITLARRSSALAKAGSVLREENQSLIARSKEAMR